MSYPHECQDQGKLFHCLLGLHLSGLLLSGLPAQPLQNAKIAFARSFAKLLQSLTVGFQ
jgi:hypothetical protein